MRRLVLTRKVKALLRRVRRAGSSLRIQENAFYWRFVEFGTSKMRARPFLRPAFDNNKDAINDTFIRVLSKGIDEAVVKLGGKAA